MNKTEQIREQLWYEVLEDYVLLLQMTPYAKDKAKNMDECRKQLDKVAVWIEQKLSEQRQEWIDEKLGFLNIDGKSIDLDKTIRLDTKSEQIREMLFEFWSAMRDKESDNRDNHVEKVIEKFEALLSEQRQEAHNANNGWCCACSYDQIELESRIKNAIDDYQTNYEQKHIASALELQKVELLSKIKGLGCNKENDLETIARVINTLK